MRRADFEKLAIEALEELPQVFQEKLNNVELTISAWPNAKELARAKVGPAGTLLGLYQGVPQTKRGASYSALPDKITLFAEPILALARTPSQIKTVVSQVVRHEIGHHFGLSEEKIRKAVGRT